MPKKRLMAMQPTAPESPHRAAARDASGTPQTEPTRGAVLWLVTWSIACGLGFAMLWSYGAAPGQAAAPPRIWPADCGIERARDALTVVMFVHPHCACTRASLAELHRFAARTDEHAALTVCVFRPAGAPDDWHRTGLWHAARRIPGVAVRRDDGGAAALCFGARTSGQVVAYDHAGSLVFHGGITPERGHSGDSLGLDALVALAGGIAPENRQTPVFGCPIHDAPNEGSVR